MSASSKFDKLLFLSDPDTGYTDAEPWNQEQLVLYAERMAKRHERHAQEWRDVAARLKAGDRPRRKS